MARNAISIGLLAGLALLAGAGCERPAAAEPSVRVYRSATCGCCKGWARHLEANGFAVEVIDVADLEGKKAELAIPRELESCHTAEVEGYLVEGHVPAEDVQRLLRERPDVRGLAVPGMPEGSPGMEGPNPEPYTVWAFDLAGRATPFARHGPGDGAPR